MKFSISPAKRVKSKTSEVYDLVTLQDEINRSCSGLDDSIKQMHEIQQILDNINFSVEAITKYGDNAIKVLNVDGSLEALLQIPEKLITVEKSIEGFADAAKNVWEKIKEMILGFVQKIKSFFSKTGVLTKFSEAVLSEQLTDLQYYAEHPDAYTVDFSENLRYSSASRAILNFRSVYPIKDVSKFLIVETTKLYGKAYKFINELAKDKESDDHYDHDYARFHELTDDANALNRALESKSMGSLGWSIDLDNDRNQVSIDINDTNFRGAGDLADKPDQQTLKGLGCRGAVDAKAIIDTINALYNDLPTVERQLDTIQSLFSNIKTGDGLRTSDGKGVRESACIANFLLQILKVEAATYREWFRDLVNLGKEFQWHLVRKGKTEHYDNTNTNHND